MIKLRLVKDKKTGTRNLQAVLPDSSNGTIIEGSYQKLTIQIKDLKAEFHEWLNGDEREWLVDFYMDEKEGVPVLILKEGFNRYKIPIFSTVSLKGLDIKISKI